MSTESPKSSDSFTTLGKISLLLFVVFRLCTSDLPLIYLLILFGAILISICVFYSKGFRERRKSIQQWNEKQAIISALFEQKFGVIDRLEPKIERRIKRVCRYDLFELHGANEGDLTACLYFKKDADIDKARSDGVLDKVLNIIYDEIEIAGRGTRENVLVDFQVDSIENVDRKFGGPAPWPLH